MKRLIPAGIGLCVGIVLGVFFGSGIHTSQHRVLINRELRSLSVITEALQALQGQDTLKAEKVLEGRMGRSLADLADLTQVPAPLDDPSLMQAITDAENYAQRHKMDEAAAQARVIGRRLRQ